MAAVIQRIGEASTPIPQACEEDLKRPASNVRRSPTPPVPRKPVAVASSAKPASTETAVNTERRCSRPRPRDRSKAVSSGLTAQPEELLFNPGRCRRLGQWRLGLRQKGVLNPPGTLRCPARSSLRNPPAQGPLAMSFSEPKPGQRPLAAALSLLLALSGCAQMNSTMGVVQPTTVNCARSATNRSATCANPTSACNRRSAPGWRSGHWGCHWRDSDRRFAGRHRQRRCSAVSLAAPRPTISRSSSSLPGRCPLCLRHRHRPHDRRVQPHDLGGACLAGCYQKEFKALVQLRKRSKVSDSEVVPASPDRLGHERANALMAAVDGRIGESLDTYTGPPGPTCRSAARRASTVAQSANRGGGRGSSKNSGVPTEAKSTSSARYRGPPPPARSRPSAPASLPTHGFCSSPTSATGARAMRPAPRVREGRSYRSRLSTRSFQPLPVAGKGLWRSSTTHSRATCERHEPLVQASGLFLPDPPMVRLAGGSRTSLSFRKPQDLRLRCNVTANRLCSRSGLPSSASSRPSSASHCVRNSPRRLAAPLQPPPARCVANSSAPRAWNSSWPASIFAQTGCVP